MKAYGRWVPRPTWKIGASHGCKSTGSKKRGIDYHNRVYKSLRQLTAELKADGWKLLIEPWYKNLDTQRCRQPDAVLLHEEMKVAIVIEVKLNWRDGRDVKLVDEYLPIVKTAHKLDYTWPLLITQCLRGWQGDPLLQLRDFDRCQSWQPGDVTPLMLVVA